jgi:hypothetical protein
VFVGSKFSCEREKRKIRENFKGKLNATGKKEDDAIIKIRSSNIKIYDSSVSRRRKRGERIHNFAISPHCLCDKNQQYYSSRHKGIASFVCCFRCFRFSSLDFVKTEKKKTRLIIINGQHRHHWKN